MSYGPTRTFASWGDRGEWKWFALKVAPGKELAVERILREEGFDVFVPVWHHRKSKRRFAGPRLPGYVFIGFNGMVIPWAKVLRFRMIIGVIAFGDAPVSFPLEDMFRLAMWSQRPIRVASIRSLRRRQRNVPDEELIVSGPYQGHAVRAVPIEQEVELYELLAKSSALG